MSLNEKLRDDLKESMRNGDSLRRSVIRLLLSAIKNEEIRVGKELDDDGIISVLSRQAKQRRQSIEAYSKAGADIITIHPEATDNLQSSILKIKELKKKVGISLNPETKIDVITKYLDQIDLVLIMSVNPGFGWQKFMPEVLEKIKDLKKIQNEKKLNFDIEIDGGINFENSKSAIEAGANILVSGTTIF